MAEEWLKKGEPRSDFFSKILCYGTIYLMTSITLIPFTLVLTLTSCNSVFYQPESTEFFTPAKVQVDYDRHRIRTSDGVTLQLWHMKPGEFYGPQPAKGVVLQFHGNGENMSTHFFSAVWLTAAGYHVVAFDYRGYGHSDPVSPSREGCLLDGEAAIKWIESERKLASLPLFVLGQSLGGAIAVPLVARSKPEQLRGLILDSTFSSYRRIARKKLAGVWLTWPLQWPLSFLVTDSYSPIDYIQNINVPILAVHAPKDPVVPYELGRELYEEGKMPDKMFWDIDLGGHSAAFAVEDSKYREKLVEWLDQHLQK